MEDAATIVLQAADGPMRFQERERGTWVACDAEVRSAAAQVKRLLCATHTGIVAMAATRRVDGHWTKACCCRRREVQVGPVTVNSTCRSHSHNARVGGAKQSFHLSGSAADFRIAGNPGATLAFLKAHRSVGGLKHYGGGVFHIDAGPRWKTWWTPPDYDAIHSDLPV